MSRRLARSDMLHGVAALHAAEVQIIAVLYKMMMGRKI